MCCNRIINIKITGDIIDVESFLKNLRPFPAGLLSHDEDIPLPGNLEPPEQNFFRIKEE